MQNKNSNSGQFIYPLENVSSNIFSAAFNPKSPAEVQVFNTIGKADYKYDPQTNEYVIGGKTGGGKSTLIDIIMGLLPPTRGEVLIDGIDINLPKNKKFLKALNLAKTLKTTTNVKEIATELGYLNESKVDISYTDPGFRFYKMKVDGKRLDREEGTEYLKGLGIDMEIPRSYNQSTLDKIVGKLKEKGIDADHDAAMDVS